MGETWQNCCQVLADRQPQPTAALYDRKDRGHLGARLMAAELTPFLRPMAIGRMEFSARSFDNSSSGYWRKRVSLFHSDSVYLAALPAALFGSTRFCAVCACAIPRAARAHVPGATDDAQHG